jgi:hypothetical protein
MLHSHFDVQCYAFNGHEDMILYGGYLGKVEGMPVKI